MANTESEQERFIADTLRKAGVRAGDEEVAAAARQWESFGSPMVEALRALDLQDVEPAHVYRPDR